MGVRVLMAIKSLAFSLCNSSAYKALVAAVKYVSTLRERDFTLQVLIPHNTLLSRTTIQEGAEVYNKCI